MRIIRKCKVFTTCIIIIFICLLASHDPQAQLILKEYSPPPTLEFANLDSQIRGELYKALKNVLDVELVRAKKQGRYEDVLFNYLYVLLKQLDSKQKDNNLQETDIVTKNALSEDHELFISFAGGIAGAGVQFLTGIPAPFLGEGAKLLGFKLGEYLVLRDISSATMEYARIGRIEIVYVRSKNKVFVNVRLDEPVCKEVFILVPIELKPMKTSWGTYVCPRTWAGLTCPPEAAVKEIVPKLEDVKTVQSPRKDRVCAIQSAVQPSITSSLQITPKKEKYQVGDVLTAEFNIANKGNASITFDVVTVGGRINDICPNDKCPDFNWKRDVTLKPNETYHYNGKLKLETSGDYHFFTVYKTKDGWNTAIPTTPGVTNTKDINVEASVPKKAEPNKLTGFVKDQHGNPVEKAAVWLVNYFKDWRDYIGSESNQKGYFKLDITRFAEGKHVLYIIKGVDTSHWYALKRADLYEPFKKEISITKKAKAEGIFLGTITFRKWYRITAKVIDRSGLPYVVYAGVYKPGSSTPSWQGWSDKIETGPLPDGVYRLKLWAHPIGWELPEKPMGWESTEREVIISGSDIDLGTVEIPRYK